MATDQSIQTFVHRLEEGTWVKWVQVGFLVAVMVAMFTAFVFDPWGWGTYKGLFHPKAMEQAQIARELANGNGFSTKMIRPLAYAQLKANMGYVNGDRFPDVYQAPLWPVTLAPCLYVLKAWPECTGGSLIPFSMPSFHAPAKSRLQMSTRDYVYVGDRMVSAVGVIFFFLTVIVSYFTARRIFDKLIGIWTMVLMMACSLYWQYAVSGLPQMLMAFIFSLAVYALVRAIEAKEEGRWPIGWLCCISFLLGLLTLAHGVAESIFFGAVIFCVLYFMDFSWVQLIITFLALSFLKRLIDFLLNQSPRFGLIFIAILGLGFLCSVLYSLFFRPSWRKATSALWMILVFSLVCSLWSARNERVCHDPNGIKLYSYLSQVRGGTEDVIMRSTDLDLTGVSPATFRRKIQGQIASQIGNLFNSFGSIVVVPVFFLALMHLFKNPVPRALRWALFSMWFCSLFGMAVLGGENPALGLSSSDLNILFIPMFSAFGMAFILVLWNRMEIHVTLLKYAFFLLIFGICSLPLINVFTINANKNPINWPPYFPPYIAILRDWTTPNEVIATDMPWAVAWYADRKSLWLPMTIQNFLDFHDYERLGGKVAGIYLTPVTGDGKLIGDIVKGDYKDWAPFILRTVGIKDFPLRTATAMPIDNQCIFYSDRDRWTDRAD